MKVAEFKSLLLGLALALVARLSAAELPHAVTRPIDFVADVQPILSSRCYECHGEKKQKAELRWDVKGSALGTGEHGVRIVPGKSADSLMIQLVAGMKGADMRMPAK